jgi:hypothetical protein
MAQPGGFARLLPFTEQHFKDRFVGWQCMFKIGRP